MPNPLLDNRQLGPDVARANLLTNGGFEIWQRGSSASASGTYGPDRWLINTNGTDALSLSRSTTNVDVGSSACVACTFTKGTGSTVMQLLQAFRSADSGALLGRTVSASMRVLAFGANQVRIVLTSDGTGGGTVFSPYHSGSGTYQTLTVTYTVPANATEVDLGVQIAVTCSPLLDNASLVVGSQPANYVPLHPADDLGRCLRYYEVAGPSTASVTVSGIASAAGQSIRAYIRYTRKAVMPTLTRVGTWALGNASAQPVTPAVDFDGNVLQVVSSAAGDTYGQNTPSSYLTIEANP